MGEGCHSFRPENGADSSLGDSDRRGEHDIQAHLNMRNPRHQCLSLSLDQFNQPVARHCLQRPRHVQPAPSGWFRQLGEITRPLLFSCATMIKTSRLRPKERLCEALDGGNPDRRLTHARIGFTAGDCHRVCLHPVSIGCVPVFSVMMRLLPFFQHIIHHAPEILKQRCGLLVAL